MPSPSECAPGAAAWLPGITDLNRIVFAWDGRGAGRPGRASSCPRDGPCRTESPRSIGRAGGGKVCNRWLHRIRTVPRLLLRRVAANSRRRPQAPPSARAPRHRAQSRHRRQARVSVPARARRMPDIDSSDARRSCCSRIPKSPTGRRAVFRRRSAAPLLPCRSGRAGCCRTSASPAAA